MYDRLPDDFTPPPWEDREAKLIWRGKFTGVSRPSPVVRRALH